MPPKTLLNSDGNLLDSDSQESRTFAGWSLCAVGRDLPGSVKCRACQIPQYLTLHVG